MSKSKSSIAPPSILSSVSDERIAGHIFLPVSEKESTALLTLRSSFHSTFPSAFDDVRYAIPDDQDLSSFLSQPFRRSASNEVPSSHYPMLLVDVFPIIDDASSMMCLAEGRGLYLAMRYVDETLTPALDMFPQVKSYRITVLDQNLFKDRLDQCRPALVSTALSFISSFSCSDPPFLYIVLLQGRVARKAQLSHVRDFICCADSGIRVKEFVTSDLLYSNIGLEN